MDAVEPTVDAIVQFVAGNRDGASLPQIIAHVNGHDRTVQRWVADLVDAGRLKSRGKGRATRYVVPKPRPAASGDVPAVAATALPQSPAMPSQPVGTTAAASASGDEQHAAAGPQVSLPTDRQAATGGPRTSPAIGRQPVTRAPATAGKSVDNDEPPADAPFARYPDFEELYYHIFPRIVRTCMTRTNAESVVREQADFDYRTDPKRKQAFISAAMAKLDALTLEDVRPYGVGPMTYGDWRRRWNEPAGTRHW